MKTFASLAAVAALTVAVSANAATDGARTVPVAYDDLNLSSQAGLDTLDQRLERAVRKVCGKADVRRLDEVSDMTRCRTSAQASAAEQRTVALARRNDGQPLLVAVKTK
ncbi:UrcA family protein [Novosphingobium mathurense]|uniref:UrcA family protein n=1 Tax=Novosphingobium mathurense TaxID=428990 RepID=A0A1U6IGW8_9SPHN|nr:UrcA family protein [Novosphingobium mathurense]SLK07264.1 UrcA family protein [Novosphingobium mathurense]